MRKAQLIPLVALVVLPAISFPLHAQTWHRDSTFGTQGIAWIDNAPSGNRLQTTLILPDGSILLCTSQVGTDSPTLYLLTPEGKLNNTFGDQGQIKEPDVFWSGLAAYPNDKLLVSGFVQDWADNPAALWRYRLDGTPDSTFGGAGKVDKPFGNFSFQSVYFLHALADGKILAGGIAQDNGNTQHFQLTRLHADGSHDMSFGQNGITGFSFPFEQYRFNALTVQPDGKILVAANGQTVGHRNLVVFRFLSDGAPDTGFAVSGKTNTDFNFGDDYATGLLVYPDGKILATGGYQNKSTGKFVPAMVRYLANGQPDPTFGQNGEVTLPGLDLSVYFTAVQRMPDDYLLTVLPKTGADNTVKAFMVKRFKPNGQADDTANAESTADDPWGVLVGAQGEFAWTPGNQLLHIPAWVGTSTGPALQLAVARYTFDGSLSALSKPAEAETLPVRLLPNPAAGAAVLTMDAGRSEKGWLRIFSATGALRLLQSTEPGTTSLVLPETAHWPAGVYFWQFTPERGATTGGYWIKTAP